MVSLKGSVKAQQAPGPERSLPPPPCRRELGAAGVRSLLAVPVSFVSEHIETLEEIDVEYRCGGGDGRVGERDEMGGAGWSAAVGGCVGSGARDPEDRHLVGKPRHWGRSLCWSARARAGVCARAEQGAEGEHVCGGLSCRGTELCAHPRPPARLLLHRELAEECGIHEWGRVPALNTNATFIDDLADAVLEALPYVGSLAAASTTESLDCLVPLGG